MFNLIENNIYADTVLNWKKSKYFKNAICQNPLTQGMFNLLESFAKIVEVPTLNSSKQWFLKIYFD